MRNLLQWNTTSDKAIQTRKVCIKHCDNAFYRNAITTRSDETIANIAITLIHKTDTMLKKLIDSQKNNFLKNGGIKEEMYKTRTEWRKENGL